MMLVKFQIIDHVHLDQLGVLQLVLRQGKKNKVLVHLFNKHRHGGVKYDSVSIVKGQRIRHTLGVQRF